MNGQTIGDSDTRGIVLKGPSAGRSQSFEKFQAADRPLDVADFEITLEGDGGEVIVRACPVQHIPADQSPSESRGKTLVHFDPATCSACRVNTRCPVKMGKRVATVTIDDASYRGASRHHQYMEKMDYRKQCAIRAGVEATVSEMVCSRDVRKSRHRTESRTRLQLPFAAIACNVKRFIRHGLLYGYVTSGAVKTTVVNSFSSIKTVFRCIYSTFCGWNALFSLKIVLF